MTKIRTRLIAAVSATVLIGSIAACAPSGTPAEGELTTLQFGLPTQMGANNSPMAVAQNLGYFAEEGLQVEIVNTKDSAAILQGVTSGALDIGSTPPEPLLQLKSTAGDDADIQLMYNYIRKQTGSIAVLASSDITSLEDFEGTTIGQASLGTSNMLLSNGILNTAGLEPDADFQNLAVGTGAAALQALQSDQVQALSLWDTEYAAMEANGVKLRYFTIPEVENLFSTTYFTTPEFLEEHRDQAVGFGRAMAKATLFTSLNPAAALQIMYADYPETRTAGVSEADQLAKDLTGLERRVKLLTAGDPQTTGTWGAYDPTAVSAWATFALESGIVTTEVDTTGLATDDLVADYNDFDASAVEAAAKSWTAGK